MCYEAVADPGFPVGGVDLAGGRGLPRRLHFVKFECRNKRIGSLRGGRAPGAPHWIRQYKVNINLNHNGYTSHCFVAQVIISQGYINLQVAEQDLILLAAN